LAQRKIRTRQVGALQLPYSALERSLQRRSGHTPIATL
jgi:hypothetical protein